MKWVNIKCIQQENNQPFEHHYQKTISKTITCLPQSPRSMETLFLIKTILLFPLFNEETLYQLIIKELIDHIIGNKILVSVWINTCNSHNFFILLTKNNQLSFQKVQLDSIRPDIILLLILLDIQNKFCIKMSLVEFLKLMVNTIAYTQPINFQIQIKKECILSIKISA